jgi:hypothetical protein
LKKIRLGCVQKEMVTVKHPEREGSTRLIAPGFEVAKTNPVILQTAECGDGAAEGRLDCVQVSLENGKICPKDGKHDLHDLWLGQHFFGSAIQATQFVQEFALRKCMDWPFSMGDLRCTMRGDKKVNRLNTRLPSELTGEFKTDQRSQAVTEEGEGFVQQWTQG